MPSPQRIAHLLFMGCGTLVLACGSTAPDAPAHEDAVEAGGAAGTGASGEGGSNQAVAGGHSGNAPIGGNAGQPQQAGMGGAFVAPAGGAVGTTPIGGMAGNPNQAGQAGGSPEPVSADLYTWYDSDFVFARRKNVQTHAPDNWFAPVNYYEGQLHIELDVAKAPAGMYRIELCMWKTRVGDSKHTCVWLVNPTSGTGIKRRRVSRTGALLLNPLAKATMTDEDFKTPFGAQMFRLTDPVDRTQDIAGPVEARLRLILVPKGQEFPGWDAIQ